MGHSHDHSPHDHSHANRRALVLVLALTGTYMVVEIIGGLLTGSLALLADAAHMASDNLAIALALFAFWLSAKPSTPNRSFGYKRVEILAALANGIAIVLVSFWIFFEAAGRFADPPEILGGWMMAVAATGLFVNVAGAVILARSAGGNLNMQGAFRHVLADLLGSVGVILAAGIIIVTGWTYADPIISIGVGVLVLASSWKLLKEPMNILLEATPSDIDAAELGRRMASSPGVAEVHDLHIWTITSEFPALSAHVLVGRNDDCHARRRDLEEMLRERYGIEHTTLQVDHIGDHAPHGQRFLPLGKKSES